MKHQINNKYITYTYKDKIMMNDHTELICSMIKYFSGDPKRIQHFMKVHSFALMIANMESLPADEIFTLEVASITHDIGIKISEQKYGDCTGKHQELEGPAEAEKMLTALGYSSDVIERVCWLIAHHHTYKNIDSADYRILVESDFLVNMYEDELPLKSVISAYNKIFRTESGRMLCRDMFGFTDIDAVSAEASEHNNETSDSVSTKVIPDIVYQTMRIRRGFAVSDKCIQCRTCIDVCPEQCIDGSRRPVYIDQSACAHCGTCFNVCTHRAIIRI